jgi:acyl-coenzyme A thioesterase PaaI-like protein
LIYYSVPDASSASGSPTHGFSAGSAGSDASKLESSASDPSILDKINILFALGTGMNGHPHILHGGITAVLMDESMGMALQCANEHAESQGKKAAGVGSFTKTLSVEFVAPVRTPGIVLMEVEVAERRGRGVRLMARLLQKEGGDEEVEGELVECARGEGVFVTPRVVKL